MLKFSIMNSFSGDVQFTAEIDCADGAPTSTKIGLAVEWAIKSGAYLRDADLRGAYLSGADLRGADLSGADLSGAYLTDQWIIQGPCRSDGYAFFLQKLKGDKEPMVRAGCRYFTISDAQKHWERTRAGEKLLDETKVIVRGMIELARIRGLME